MRRITSRGSQRNFRLVLNEELKAPLLVTQNGLDRLVLLSVEEYARLKRRDREALLVEKLSEVGHLPR